MTNQNSSYQSRAKLLVVVLLLSAVVAPATADDKAKALADLGTESLQPIDAGFLFKDGRYIDAPYIIERRGTDIYVNGELFRNGPEWPPYDWSVKDDPGDPPADWSPFGPVRQGDPRDDYWSKKWRFLAQHYEQVEARQLMIDAYRKSPFVKDVVVVQPDLSFVEVVGQGAERMKVSVAGGKAPPPPAKDQYLAPVRQSMGNLADSLRRGSVQCDFHNGTLITGSMPTSQGLEILASTRPVEEKIKRLEGQRLFATELPETKQLITNFRPSAKFLERIEQLRGAETKK